MRRRNRWLWIKRGCVGRGQRSSTKTAQDGSTNLAEVDNGKDGDEDRGVEAQDGTSTPTGVEKKKDDETKSPPNAPTLTQDEETIKRGLQTDLQSIDEYAMNKPHQELSERIQKMLTKIEELQKYNL